MAFWLPMAMAGLSAVQQNLKARDEQRNQDIQNQLAAERDRTSYITNRPGQLQLGARNPYSAMLDGAMQGGIAGLSMGQDFSQMNSNDRFRQAQIDYYNKKGRFL